LSDYEKYYKNIIYSNTAIATGMFHNPGTGYQLIQLTIYTGGERQSSGNDLQIAE